MQYDLVVVIPFGAYRVGDRITDPVTVAQITASEQFVFVVPVVHVGGSGTSAPVMLVALTLSTLVATAGTAWLATVAGLTAGSTLAATASDGTALTVAPVNGVPTVSGTFAAAGTPTLTLTETLAGATNTPRATALVVAVGAAAGGSGGSGGGTPADLATNFDDEANAALVPGLTA